MHIHIRDLVHADQPETIEIALIRRTTLESHIPEHRMAIPSTTPPRTCCNEPLLLITMRSRPPQ
jgi:hypothetical protein